MAMLIDATNEAETTPYAGMPADVGINDPNPNIIPGGSTDQKDPVPDHTTPPDTSTAPPLDAGGTTVQDLYGEGVTDAPPTAQFIDTPTVADPTGASVVQNDASVAEVGTPGTGVADPSGAISDPSGVSAEQTSLTSEQQVDAELARILGKDSPLLARARAEAAQYSNKRGLMNSSMAAGAAQGAMVDRALPMAQQNAQQAFQRESANTGLRQQATTFTAEQQNRLAALEAELGTSVSVFNAEQLNQAESLSAQMRTAMEQQDTEAYNRASMQLADLQRSAEAQQADIDMAGAQQTQAEQQAYNQQTMDRVTELNLQYLQGSQAMDLATIQGTYQQIISTNETAGGLYNTYMSAIAGVMDNPDMTSSQIAAAVTGMQKSLQSGLAMITEINGLDLGDYGGDFSGGGGDYGGFIDPKFTKYAK